MQPQDKPYTISQKILQYIRYLRQAKTRYGIHSPFVYALADRVPQIGIPYEIEEKFRLYRKKLLSDKSYIEIRDLGAGSGKFGSSRRRIDRMARYAGSGLRDMRRLYRLTRYFKPSIILELGTHLGQGTLALAFGNPDATIITVEGSNALVEYTGRKLAEAGVKNVRLETGSFGDFLHKDNHMYDLIFLDGHHNYEAVKKYVRILKSRMHDESLLLIDDIHWSPGMERAWNDIVNDKDFHVTVDLFYAGLVWKRTVQFKEHFVLRCRK